MKAQTDAHFYQSIFDFVIYHLRQIFFSHVGTKPPLPGCSLILKRVCITLTLFKTSGKHVVKCSHLYIEKRGFAGVNLIFFFLIQNIHCEYSLEPPRQGGKAVLTCTHNVCFEQSY